MEFKNAAWERVQKDTGLAQVWQHLDINIFSLPDTMGLQICIS